MAYLFVDNASTVSPEDGSHDAPYTTFTEAIAAASKDDTIVVKYGTGRYDLTNEGTSSSPNAQEIRIDKRLTITGQVWSEDFDDDIMPVLSTGKITGPGDWALDATDDTGGTVYYIEIPSTDDPQAVFDTAGGANKYQQKGNGRVTSLAAMVSNSRAKTFWDSTNQRLYYVSYSDGNSGPFTNPGSNSPDTVTVPMRGQFFTLEDDSADGTVIENLRFDEFGDAAIKSGNNDNLIVRRCIFEHGYGPSILFDGVNECYAEANWIRNMGEKELPSAGSPKGLVIVQATMVSIPIQLNDCFDCVARGNYIKDYAQGAISIGYADTGELRNGGRNVVVGNTAENGAIVSIVAGFNIAFGAYSQRAHNSFTAGVEGLPDLRRPPRDYVVRNISIRSGSAGINLNEPHSIVVANNLFFENVTGVRYKEQVRDTWVVNNLFVDNGEETYDDGTSWLNFTLLGGEFVRNLVEVTSPPKQDLFLSAGGTEGKNFIDDWRLSYHGYNLYYRSSGTQVKFYWASRKVGFEEWKFFNPDDRSSVEVTGADSPIQFGFRNPDDRNFHLGRLATGNPTAVDFGLDITNLYAEKPLAGRMQVRGEARDAGPFEFDSDSPSHELFIQMYLTGNDDADDTQIQPNRKPSLSVGGRPLQATDALANPRNLFDNPRGEDLRDGITQYRAVDIANIATLAGDGSVSGQDRNFRGLIHRYSSVGAYIESQPENTGITFAIGWEDPDASPGGASPSGYQGPLANDQTAPEAVDFVPAASISDEIDLPAGNLNAITTTGTITFGRLWIRRTIAPGTEWSREQTCKIRLTGGSQSKDNVS